MRTDVVRALLRSCVDPEEGSGFHIQVVHLRGAGVYDHDLTSEVKGTEPLSEYAPKVDEFRLVNPEQL